MRASDYPPPSYAGHCWYAGGHFWLARSGASPQSFPDTPDGVNALREALRACGGGSGPLGTSNLREAPVRRFTASGRPKLDEGDLWAGGLAGAAPHELSSELDSELERELQEAPKSLLKEHQK